ncbi:olfactory receptor 1020-like [Thamnophis elegans]|uniref:olfactory receptor 1020-like n=1 Tax=Thamnophis elegans TaxID=35005 RepID=UPI001377029E|nr:olfactory receptor 1020-like [Thamnophis elegans]
MEINWSNVTTFILLGFNLPQMGILLFALFFLIYSLSIVGNLLIVLLVVADQHLHTPMYFFLVNLSFLETCYITTILLRMLASFITGDKSISVNGCITQYYFFGFLASTECYLLAMMSYDRYLAICKPLHYGSVMNGKLCFQLALISWMSGLLTNTIIIGFLLQLTFCGPSEIDHFFCDVSPIENLSCSSTHLVKLVTFITGSMRTPFLLTMTSYICILYTVLQMKSKTAQQKAFSTCSSHLTVVSFFFLSLLLVYVVPETEKLKELHKIFSLFYTVMPPMLNPIIYSLRNREVKEAFFKTIRKYSSSFYSIILF